MIVMTVPVLRERIQNRTIGQVVDLPVPTTQRSIFFVTVAVPQEPLHNRTHDQVVDPLCQRPRDRSSSGSGCAL